MAKALNENFIMLLHKNDFASPLVDSTCTHRTRVAVYVLSQDLTQVHTTYESIPYIFRSFFLPYGQLGVISVLFQRFQTVMKSLVKHSKHCVATLDFSMTGHIICV